ncbi:phospholipase A2 inhibitor and Ly6/PLAUR domain-containing protein-like [Discoglossus pictus]
MIMKSYFPFICIISAFITKGYSLSCIECSSKEGTTCSGRSRFCFSEDSCISSIIKLSNNEQEQVIFNRGCAQSRVCDQSGSLTDAKISTTCCNTDDCTPITPTLPPDNTTKNGVACERCLSDDLDNCNGNTVKCTGDEDVCFMAMYTELGSTSESVWKGCTSKQGCGLIKLLIEQQISVNTTSITCMSGSHGLKHSIIVMFFVVFLSLIALC